MSDCERVRAHASGHRVLHQVPRGPRELTSFILKNVCCTLAAMLHPSDMGRPTQPYGLEEESHPAAV